MLNSLKRLLRTPFKTLLFFLLMTASTVLLIFGAVMLWEAHVRIGAAEAEFSTVGTVEQKPDAVRTEIVSATECAPELSLALHVYDEVLSPELLKFEGAEYINEPTQRPYYMTLLPELNPIKTLTTDGFQVDRSSYIIEFTPIEDRDLPGHAEVKVVRVLHRRETSYDLGVRGMEPMHEGNEITLCYCGYSAQNAVQLKAGKTYICTLIYDLGLYTVGPAPFSTQYGAEDGVLMTSSAKRSGNETVPVDARLPFFSFSSFPERPAIEEVTEGFWAEDEQGALWFEWVKAHDSYRNYFLVQAVNGLQLIPEFHEKQVYVGHGREITDEEFRTGAAVCMVSREFAVSNRLTVGDTVTLPLVYALYGYLPDRERTYTEISPGYPTFHRGYSPLNAEGKLYAPFWEAEYEIVGLYEPLAEGTLFCGESSLAKEMFIIPAKSVKASDRNNIAHYGAMHTLNTSFQIQNGTIQEFDAKLRAAVSNAEKLVITYDDNGYSKVMNDLENARLSAFLLCAVGVLSTLGIVILLLYFFVVRQKKRTAIERSLGMTRRQCAVSLLAGIMILTLLSVTVGSICGAALMHGMELTEFSEPIFDTMYSLWADGETGLTAEPEAPLAYMYILLPLCVLVLTGSAGYILLHKNMKTEVMLLLSVKGE